MKQFFVLCALLATTCSATYLHGGVSTQYASLDPHSHSYAYGYADPNSQKHETRSHDGITRGSYSYVDGHGLLQSVSYVADPHHGFQAVGTNLPKAPIAAAVAVGPVAHYAAPVAHYAAGHAYPEAHIVLDHKGVPVDTPEVQHAKAAHAAAYAAAAAGSAHGGHHHLYKRSVWGAGYGHGGAAYAGHAANIVLGPGGVPVDTPDVQIAKAEHAAAHSKALSAAVHAGAGAGHGAGAGGYGGAYAGAGGHGGGLYSGAHGYHVPVITHQGVPVETPEVQHAKSAHFAAVAKAAAESGASGHDDGSYHGDYDGGYGGAGAGAGAYGGHAGAYAGAGAGVVGPAHYTAAIQHGGAGAGAGYGGGYKGPLHYPVLKNGVPLEPAEVQHARAAHLSALASESAKAAAHGGYYGAHYAKW